MERRTKVQERPGKVFVQGVLTGRNYYCAHSLAAAHAYHDLLLFIPCYHSLSRSSGATFVWEWIGMVTHTVRECVKGNALARIQQRTLYDSHDYHSRASCTI
jgi:hypothetical protein